MKDWGTQVTNWVRGETIQETKEEDGSEGEGEVRGIKREQREARGEEGEGRGRRERRGRREGGGERGEERGEHILLLLSISGNLPGHVTLQFSFFINIFVGHEAEFYGMDPVGHDLTKNSFGALEKKLTLLLPPSPLVPPLSLPHPSLVPPLSLPPSSLVPPLDSLSLH
jgi:hypothetical protein